MSCINYITWKYWPFFMFLFGWDNQYKKTLSTVEDICGFSGLGIMCCRVNRHIFSFLGISKACPSLAVKITAILKTQCEPSSNADVSSAGLFICKKMCPNTCQMFKIQLYVVCQTHTSNIWKIWLLSKKLKAFQFCLHTYATCVVCFIQHM
jgi:hypothetical protein